MLAGKRRGKPVGIDRVLEVSDGPESLLGRAMSQASGVIQQLDPVSDKERGHPQSAKDNSILCTEGFRNHQHILQS